MNEAAAAGHIVIEVSDPNCRSILATSYGLDGPPFGEYMRVCLTNGEPAVKGRSPTRLVRAMPDMWDDLARFLRFHSYHGVNEAQSRKHIGALWARLALRIERHLAKVANHPAYRNNAVLGIDRTVLSAWRADGRYRLTAIAAIEAGEKSIQHGLLVPKITIIASRSVTSWEFRPTSGQTDSTDLAEQPDPRSA